MSDGSSRNAAPPGSPAVAATRLIHDGWGRFLIASLVLPSGETIHREVEDHGAAVAVLPYDPERRVAMLVRQLRIPAFLAAGVPSMLEAPAGRLEAPDPEDCARREVFEEVGLRLERLEPLMTTWSIPSVSTERIHLFLATYAAPDKVGPGGGLAEEGEAIEIEEIPLADLGRMLDAGRLVDLKTVALVLLLRARRPDLFAG